MTATPSPIDVFGDEPEAEDAPAKTREELEDEAWCDRVWRTYERESRERAMGLARDDLPALQFRQPPAPAPLQIPGLAQEDDDQPAVDSPPFTPAALTELAERGYQREHRHDPSPKTEETIPVHLTERQQQCLAAIRELHAEGKRATMVSVSERAGIPGPTKGARASTTSYALKSLKGVLLDWTTGPTAEITFRDQALPPAPWKRQERAAKRASKRKEKEEVVEPELPKRFTGRYFPAGTEGVPPERIVGVALEDSTPMPDGTHQVKVAWGPKRSLADVAAAHTDPVVAMLQERRAALVVQVERIDKALAALEA